MKKKQLLNYVSAGILAAALAVCSAPAAAKGEEENQTAMGRYLESELSFPGEEDNILVLDMERTADGNLRIITADPGREGPIRLWESSDLGESWELAAALPETLNDLYITRLTLCADGGGAGVGMLFDEEDNYELHYVSFDAAGNAQEVSFPDETVNLVSFSRDGKMAGRTWSGAAYSLDRENAGIENTFASSGVEQMGICRNEALLVTASEVLRYDLDSVEPLEADEALNSALFSEGKEYTDGSTFGSPLIFDEDEEGRLIFCTNSGIFVHAMGGSVVEQVVDGTLGTISDPSLSLVSVTELNGIFFVTYVDNGMSSKILKYAYDPDVPSQPETEVAIYSLRENPGLRQTITAFQNLHPDIYINYETGMNGADGVTAADALRTLNTDILAGNGPDVLIFDGMSVETYAKKGLLEDLSSILDEVKAEEGLLENITDTWKSADGVLAVPAGFGVFMAAGKEDLTDSLEEPASLVELSKIPGAMDDVTVIQLPDVLYYLCAEGWKQEDHTIDQEKLAGYVTMVKEIYDNSLENFSDTEKSRISQWWEQEGAYLDTLTCYGDMKFVWENILSGRAAVSPGILLEMGSFCLITSAEEQIGGCSNRLFSLEQSGTFFPVCTTGILTTAREPESAREFVKFLLSKEGELANEYDGLPVNLAALEERIYTNPYADTDAVYSFSSENRETGELLELTAVWPEKEQLDWLMQSARSLTVRAETEQVQKDVVVGETRRCLNGEISADEAVNSIMQKLNLYLAENGE